MTNIAIKVENLSKAYQLGEIGTGTISRDLERWWAKFRGKEDPFLKIGQTNDRTSKAEQGEVVWSLKDINFEIEQGQAVGIIGRNGAGKSTLLKILSRVTSPTTGNVKLKGRVASLLEVGTGFHPELTGRENIYLNGAILGMRKAEIKRKFDEIVDFAGVEKYIDTPVKRYSSGMYVRLAFAVAAHLESEILIVDEVLAVGDAEFQKKCLGKMGDVSSREGRTVLFVSHNMDAVRGICSKSILLLKGELEKYGNTNDTINEYLNRKDSFFTRNNILSLKLNDLVEIKYFKLSKNIINSFEDINYSFSIVAKEENKYQSLVLLLSDEFNHRVAIADLRHEHLFRDIKSEAELRIDGTIQNIPLLSGTYSIGLYIESVLYSGNLYGVAEFEIQEKQSEILPYDKSVRGKINLHHDYIFS